MEGQDVDAADVAQGGGEGGDARDVLGGVGQARDQDEARPDLLAQFGQAAGEGQRRFQLPPGEARVELAVPGLDPGSPHVQREGPHLNLETQTNGRRLPAARSRIRTPTSIHPRSRPTTTGRK